VGFSAQMEADLDRIAAGERDWVPVLHEFYEPFAVTLASAKAEMPEVVMGGDPTGELCPQCGNPLIFKYGRFGKFIGCSNFPQCRHSAAILIKTGAKCPECGGDLVEKRTRRGRTFYGCANYKADDPASCRFGVWKRPLPQGCPSCGGLLTEARQAWAKCVACEDEVEISRLPAPPQEVAA
jgi:DNA topoisomerase I